MYQPTSWVFFTTLHYEVGLFAWLFSEISSVSQHSWLAWWYYSLKYFSYEIEFVLQRAYIILWYKIWWLYFYNCNEDDDYPFCSTITWRYRQLYISQVSQIFSEKGYPIPIHNYCSFIEIFLWFSVTRTNFTHSRHKYIHFNFILKPNG